MKKKTVGIITLHLNFGGVELASINLANMLIDDYNVTIINMYESAIAFEVDSRVNIINVSNIQPNKSEFKMAVKNKNIFNILSEGIKSLKILYLRKQMIRKHLLENDYDILISSRYLYTKLINKLNIKSKKIAIEHRHHNNDKKYIYALKRATSNIDYLVTVSNELKEFYEKKFNVKCIYIPNCIEFYPRECSLKDNKQLIAVGRLEPEKGFDDLIDIFAEVNKKHKDWKLIIAGDGQERNRLLAKIKEANLIDKIELTGFLEKEKLNKLYDDSSIYLMTSHEESFGIVVVEAQSFGVPCITFSTATGVLELINEKNGIIIPGRDKKQMVESIIMLIENNQLRKEMSLSARKNARKFSLEKVKKTWLDFLK